MPGIWPSQPAGRLHGIEVCFGELVLQPVRIAPIARRRRARRGRAKEIMA
jgi:hypothetical protein